MRLSGRPLWECAPCVLPQDECCRSVSVRDNVDGKGNQLINWVAELETEEREATRGWDKKGQIEEFLPTFENWSFDWIDVVDLIRRSEHILEYPMVDQEALPFWTQGCVTLLGDAAHPMYPRGSNGAAQAILDADYLANAHDLLGCFHNGIGSFFRRENNLI